MEYVIGMLLMFAFMSVATMRMVRRKKATVLRMFIEVSLLSLCMQYLSVEHGVIALFVTLVIGKQLAQGEGYPWY